MSMLLETYHHRLCIAVLLATAVIVANGTASIQATAADPIADAVADATRAPDAAEAVDFDRQIRPLLSDRCFACHGPDGAHRQGGLRLDEAESAYGVADSGERAVVPGDLAASTLVARIESDDAYEIMPPPEVQKPLSDEEKSLLKRWIEQGAEFQPHWSLVPPQRHPRPIPDDQNNPLEQTAPGDVAQVSDPLDAFLLEKITAAGLTPNPPASRRELLRRVTFDLSGLPPTPAELRAFEKDLTPDAYEKVVDRLLQSHHFGEHLGRYWLDLVRYGDTHGLHLDNYREMWPYRDWVISAINKNMPYDAFITAQLAGDLLPESTLEDQIASGFNRLNVTTSEGGSIYEEVFARNVIDRTDAFGTIFLGLTTGCAVCHDHKFDPISQRDYYSLSAFFNSLDGRALDGNAKDHPPVARVPTDETLKQLADVANMRSDLEAEMNGPLPTVDAAQARWEQAALASSEHPTTWQTLHPSSAESSGGSTMQVLDDGSVAAGGEVPAKETVTLQATLPAGGPYQLIRLEALSDSPETPAGRSDNGNAVLSEIEVLLKSTATGGEFTPVKLVYGQADQEQSDSPKFTIQYAIDGQVAADAGWAIGGHQTPGSRSAWFVASSLLGSETETAEIKVVLKYESQFAGHSFKRVRVAVSDDLPRVAVERQLQISPWHVVGPFEVENIGAGYYQNYASQDRAFAREESFKFRDQTLSWQTGTAFQPAMINSLPTIPDRPSVVLLHRQIVAPQAQKLTLLLGTEDGYQVWLAGKKIGEVNADRSISPLGESITLDLQAGVNDLYLKTINHSGPAAFAAAFRSPAVPVPAEILEIAKLPLEQRQPTQVEAIKHYYRRVASVHPDWLVLQDMAAGLDKRRTEIQNSMPTTLVWKELETPRPAHILRRGEYDKPGEQVTRQVPQALPKMPAELPRDRLGLARWLTLPDHPLTARVAVNRYWQQLFGTGIVKTSEDFGAQGSPPSHPQLLDTLAVDFRESGWDVKALFKRLVMTDAYRRSSRSHQQTLAIDPENRLLARGPRFRLDAEMIRDAALATSGLLVDQLGGPSVKPPQPAGLWLAVGYTGSNTANFTADSGAKVYRRSVYTFWKRTSAPPQMTTFDAPSRENCAARRERTNTPLQALMLMNEPQYLAAARSLVERSQSLMGEDPAGQIGWMFEAVTSRPPNTQEQAELMELYHDLRQHYQANDPLLKQLGAPNGDAAAALMVASTILNLDEAITK
ncbi:PSD1 and planctomycete cytochrome C domain-containing protein [Planctomycetaceae bacterium SH139]